MSRNIRCMITNSLDITCDRKQCTKNFTTTIGIFMSRCIGNIDDAFAYSICSGVYREIDCSGNSEACVRSNKILCLLYGYGLWILTTVLDGDNGILIGCGLEYIICARINWSALRRGDDGNLSTARSGSEPDCVSQRRGVETLSCEIERYIGGNLERNDIRLFLCCLFSI